MGVPLRETAVGPGWSSAWSQTRPAGSGLLVDCVWSGRAGRDGWLRVFPDGCADLTWNGDQLRLEPATASVRRVRLWAGRPSDGVRLRCGAVGALLGAAGVTGTVVELRDVPGARLVRLVERDLRAAADAPEQRRRLLARWVTDASDTRSGQVPPSGLVEQLAAGASVPSVAAAHGVSERTLRREVLAATGMRPKLLARVLRFRRFLAALEPLALGELSVAVLAAELGYADQSHFGRECRAIAASTPAALIRAWRRAG